MERLERVYYNFKVLTICFADCSIRLLFCKTMSNNRVVDEGHGEGDNSPYVHKIGVPPKQSLVKEFKFTIKETFFHDDPLREFKDQSNVRKLWLVVRSIFPILDWGRRYKLSMFRGDLLAGLTIASLCIPQVRALYIYI